MILPGGRGWEGGGLYGGQNVDKLRLYILRVEIEYTNTLTKVNLHKREKRYVPKYIHCVQTVFFKFVQKMA